MISYFAFWHCYRQHHGICKVYDAIQARRTGDATIFEDRKALDLFFAFGANLVIVWAFTHKSVRYLLSADEGYELVHPQIPLWLFHSLVAFAACVGIWGLKRAVWDRWRAGRMIPWPQISLMTVAIATYIVPYFFIPLEAMPLAVAIGTIFHNVQYFGFVWLFEKNRSREMGKLDLPLELPQRLAFQGGWKRYFGVALAYSFAVIGLYLVLPHSFGLTLIYFLGFAHYVIDGYIWRRDHNGLLGASLSRMAGAASTQTPVRIVAVS